MGGGGQEKAGSNALVMVAHVSGPMNPPLASPLVTLLGLKMLLVCRRGLGTTGVQQRQETCPRVLLYKAGTLHITLSLGHKDPQVRASGDPGDHEQHL